MSDPEPSTNAEQRSYWDGDAGRHWVAEAERYDRLNRRFAERIMETLSPQRGEKVLDVGCGNGALSVEAARRVGRAGGVTGLDLSGPMLAVARERAESQGLVNLQFVQGDAQVQSLPDDTFDAVTSRFGVMFFDDPGAAFANLARMTREGGRLVFACWQEVLLNEWLMVPAVAALEHVPLPDFGRAGAPGPFALADPARVRAVLTGAGWADVELVDAEEPMWLGHSVEDVVIFMKGTDFAETLIADAPTEVAEAAWNSVATVLEEREGPDGIELGGRAWIVSARRG